MLDFINCMQGITACGIETALIILTKSSLFIACRVLPLAVLKLLVCHCKFLHLIYCMQGITACGIETFSTDVLISSTNSLHAGYYRLRY